MTIQNRIGVLGATSFVGTCLLPLLVEAKMQVSAFSRQQLTTKTNGIEWQQLPLSLVKIQNKPEVLPYWICVAPIWVLSDYFPLLESYGVQRLVVLSSTSRYTKNDSSDPSERSLSKRFADAELCVKNWAESYGVEWVILRPTLIYGLAGDKNITEIARLIRRFGFFPLFGKANGLRQPIHVTDVAGACLKALQSFGVVNQMYNISGSEIITYREMVARVFFALERSPRLLAVPLWVFRIAVAILRRLPRYRQWSSAMAEHMNQDFVFEHSDAIRDFGFEPKAFVLSADDLPGIPCAEGRFL